MPIEPLDLVHLPGTSVPSAGPRLPPSQSHTSRCDVIGVCVMTGAVDNSVVNVCKRGAVVE